MTELKERLIAAERNAAPPAAQADVRARVVRSARRRRAVRGAVVAGSSFAAIVGIAAVGIAITDLADSRFPVSVPQVTPPVVADAAEVTRIDVGAVPPMPMTRRAWDQIDDRWVLAVWSPANAASADSVALDYPLVIAAPDGRTFSAVTVENTIAPSILAWDPVAQTALITSAATGEPEDADLGFVSLSGGENSFATECLDGLPADGAERWAVASDGGYLVHDGCGGEYWMDSAGFRRTTLTASEEATLAAARYPSLQGIAFPLPMPAATPGVTPRENPEDCTALIRERADAMGLGCSGVQVFALHVDPHAVSLVALRGGAVPEIHRLCGSEAVVGTLSDGSEGVGLVVDNVALPLMLDGSPTTDCVDGRITWYMAGGDLYSAAADGMYTRLIDLNVAAAEVPAGAGVIDVRPAPQSNSLG